MPSEQKKFPEPGEALSLILLTFIGMIVFTLTIGAALQSVLDKAALDETVRLMYIFAESLFLLVPWLYIRKKGYKMKALLRFKRVPFSVLLYSFILGLALIVLTDEIDRLIEMIVPIPQIIKDMMKPLEFHSFWDGLLIVAGTVFVAALGEEALFRGFLQATLEQKAEAHRAVIMTSVSWAVIHLNPYWAIEIFVMGVFLGYVAWRTKSLWPSILIHGLNNLTALVLLNTQWDESWGWYEWRGHVSPLVLIVAVIALVYAVKQIALYRPGEGGLSE